MGSKRGMAGIAMTLQVIDALAAYRSRLLLRRRRQGDQRRCRSLRRA
jgi:hypothetical protein